MARTFLDKHYYQQINSAQTKLQFVTENFNGGFVMPAALLVGEEKNIAFSHVSAIEQKTELQLQSNFEALSASMHIINVA